MRTGTTRRDGAGKYHGTPAPLGWLMWALSVTGLGYGLLIYGYSRPLLPRIADEFALVAALFAVSAAASTASLLIARRPRYVAVLGVRVGALLILSRFLVETPWASAIVLGGVLVELALYNEYPQNLRLSLPVAGAVAMISAWNLLRFASPLNPVSVTAAFCPLAAAALVIPPACLLTKYREDIVSAVQQKEDTDRMMADLAKANMQYQESAAGAAEAGMRDERLRITRDIHDIVGYTLTNNIALMEAATDMMRRNPLGVPALIKAARDNAEDGLHQIRDALYRLRAHGEPRAVGVRAIARLCGLFEKATRIEVRLAYTNARWEYGSDIDSAVYHLVQESLLNSFRHGRARHATVSLWESGLTLGVSVSDDGQGAESFAEGIGMRGMRERIEALGGELQIQYGRGVFSVACAIPLPQGGPA